MSETYAPAGNVGSSFQRATVAEAGTGTHGQEFMRDDITKIADKTRFLSDAGFYTASKIQFPAVFVPDVDVNALDDYEEGTFTPGIAFGGGTTGITYTARVGRYTKIGGRVFFSLFVFLSNKGSSAGTARITGLPFTANPTASNFQNVATRIDLVAAALTTIQSFISPSATLASLENVVAGAATDLTEASFTNTSNIMLSGHYET